MHLRLHVLFVAALLAPRVLAGQAIAVTFSGDVHKFDNSIATATFVGSTGFSALNSLAKNAGQRYIASSGGNASTPAKLIEIDRLTGAGTLLGTLPINGDVRGLAFDVDGTLLAAVRTTASSLYRIDPDTLATTLLGATGLSAIQALAMSPQGILYGWDAGSTGTNGLGLIRINKTNGHVTDVNAAIGGDATIQSLSFDVVGDLYGLRHDLFRINVGTGALTQIAGTNSNDFRGFEYIESMSLFDGALTVLNDGHVGRLNTQNGNATSFGNAAVSSLHELARSRSTGQFFAATGTNPSILYFVNPDTGTLTFDVFLPPHDVRAMALDAADTLFFVGDDASATQGLWKAPFISSPQLVGATGLTDVRALALSPLGKLYGWDAVAGLVTIDTATGVGTDVNPAINGQSFECLAFDPNGHLIAANDSAGTQAVYEIDVLTGASTIRGVHPIGDVRGMAFFGAYQHELPTTYCTAQTNSQGCVPSIGFAGPNVPSASFASGFQVTASNVIAGKTGLFFYGLSGRANTPFLGGTLCAGSPLKRSPVVVAGGSVASCGGVLAFDFNAYVASDADVRLVAGAIVRGQWWSRDPAASSTTNLTDALEFELAP